jgi:hydroxypyruvate isomerase
MKQRSSRKAGTSRRRVLKSAVAAAAGVGAAQALGADEPSAARALDGRLKQSIIHWCFKDHWDVEQTARVAKELGCRSVELVDPQHWPTLKKYGLTCAIAGSHGFVKGMNNSKHWAECVDIITKRIDAGADAGVTNVITFTGMRDGIADDVGAKNCVDGYKKIVGYAEKRKVTLCLEMLNSRVDVTMKGHPGYQGDHTDYCIDIIKRVGSPRLKLLFDVYHVQIMDGDVITRIRQYKDYIGHVHTAGVPGRGELDDRQEINYRGVMLALADAGFREFVGQEFIPTRDPKEGLRQAVDVCTV